LKINSVTLQNFRSHSKTDIALSPVTYFMGAAGAGKTSVLDAISTCLTGRNRYVDGKGTGRLDDIRVGQKAYEVAVNLNDGTTITRSVGARHTLVFPGAPPEVRVAQGVLLAQLGASEDVIATLLDPRLFLDRSDDDQKRVLLDVLRLRDLEVPPEALAAGITKLSSIEDLNAQLRRIKEVEIRSLNRECENMKRLLPPETNGEVGPKAGELEAKVRKLSLARDAKFKELSKVESDLASSRQTAQKYRDQAAKQASEGSTPQQVETATARIKELEAAIEKLDGAIAEGQQRIGSLESQLETKRQQYSKMGKMGKMCGVVDTITCPLEAKARKDMQGTVKTEGEEIAKDLKATKTAVAEFTKKRDAHVTEKAACGAVVASGKVAEQVAKFNSLAAEAEAKVPNLEGAIPGLNSELSKLETDLALEDAAIQTARQAEEAKRQDEKVKGELAKLTRRLEVFSAAAEALVKAREECLAAEVKPFLETMLPVLEAFGLGGLELVEEPFGLRVSGVLGSHLSSGQKVIFDGAFRMAVARKVNFPVCAMDDSNKLPDAVSRKLFGMICQSGIQVIICKTTADYPGPEVAKKMTGPVAGYWFVNPELYGPTEVKRIEVG
jgi:DNA repair exonuclease SbcCD ATPase subunit